jgi:hypothetical protein
MLPNHHHPPGHIVHVTLMEIGRRLLDQLLRARLGRQSSGELL